MAFDESLTITGLQEAQRANLKLIASLKPDGELEQAIRIGTLAAYRYAVSLTHVDTGALRASHRVRMDRSWGGVTGVVYLDPSARNPRSRQLTSQYGPAEHARGGEHAFYQQTVDRYGGTIASQIGAYYASRIGKK